MQFLSNLRSILLLAVRALATPLGHIKPSLASLLSDVLLILLLIGFKFSRHSVCLEIGLFFFLV